MEFFIQFQLFQQFFRIIILLRHILSIFHYPISIRCSIEEIKHFISTFLSHDKINEKKDHAFA